MTIPKRMDDQGDACPHPGYVCEKCGYRYCGCEDVDSNSNPRGGYAGTLPHHDVNWKHNRVAIPKHAFDPCPYCHRPLDQHTERDGLRYCTDAGEVRCV